MVASGASQAERAKPPKPCLKPRPRASLEHAELMMPVPPMKRTFMEIH
jgi:hypothetical protein